MYGENPIADTKRVLQAILTNQLARFVPHLYIKLTRQTGRGGAPESAAQIADYFYQCFDDYFQILNVKPAEVTAYLEGKRVLEYGPGNILGMALLMIAHGAGGVICVDRFPLLSSSEHNIQALQHIVNRLDGVARIRANSCFREAGNPASGFREECIRYLVTPNGLSDLTDAVDLIISRAVLEHVNDLSATFNDMHRALCDNGVAVHQVDLKSHGLHQKNPLDFLTWPPHLWKWMYSAKGVPNRWRVDRYRQVISESGLRTILIKPTLLADNHDVAAVRSYLAKPFRSIANEDLSWLGFWLVCCKRLTK